MDGTDWPARLNRAIAWLEAHLTEEIVWAAAAREAACSTFHFLRMFEVITGLTPGEYVRRRRLSRAALELTAGQARVIDVALRYGYDSPDAFARAFRRLFGCTPSAARQPGIRLRAYPPITFSITLRGVQAMEYRLESRPSFSLTGLALPTTSREGQSAREIPAFWERATSEGHLARLEALVPPTSRLGVMGVCADFDPAQDSFTYLIAIETPTTRTGMPDGCRDLTVPAATWGIFEAHGALPGSIQSLMPRIFGEWFPAAGWEHAPAPELEVYPPGDITSDDYVCEVWIPLQRPAS